MSVDDIGECLTYIYNIFIKQFIAQDYKGGNFRQKTDGIIDQKVSYEVDHGLNFRNDFKDENHRGSYKGSEFDTSYKATDIEGGYLGNELKSNYKAAAYDGGEWEGTQNQGGSYDGNDYTSYGKNDKDSKSRGYGYGTGIDGNIDRFPTKGQGYIPGGEYAGLDAETGGGTSYNSGSGSSNNGGHYNTFGKGKGGDYSGKDYDDNLRDDLYDRFRNTNRNYDNTFGHSRNSQKDNFDNDGKKNSYGAGYDGKDHFGKSYNDEAYLGLVENGEYKDAFDRGTYREVEAKGYNKQANYEGDYETSNQYQDTDYKVTHYEDLQAKFDNDINVDEYYNAYAGEDYKGGFEGDNKYGQYNDHEFRVGKDINQRYNEFNGEDYSEGIDADTSAHYRDGAKSDTTKYAEIKQYPKRKYTYNDNPYNYYYYR